MASMEPQAIPAELHPTLSISSDPQARFNGAAGDPCGVTLVYQSIRHIPHSASMEPQAIPAELRRVIQDEDNGDREGFNGAAGDPCGVTMNSTGGMMPLSMLQWSRRRSLRSYAAS